MRLSDGDNAYRRYAEQTGLTHAPWWAHTRRQFAKAANAAPAAVGQARDASGALYGVEARLRDHRLQSLPRT